MSKPKCIERVSDDTGFHFYRCGNTAKYGEYCGVHSPERRAERKKQRPPTQFERTLAESKARREHRREYREAAEALASEARIVCNEITVNGAPAPVFAGAGILYAAVEIFEKLTLHDSEPE